MTLVAGSTGTSRFNSDVTIGLCGLENGVTGTLSTNTLAAPGSDTCVVTLAASDGSMLAKTKVTVTATGGGVSALQRFTVNTSVITLSL